MSEPAADPWRRRCPEGHCSWEAMSGGYYCEVCGEHYAHLIDAKHQQQIGD